MRQLRGLVVLLQLLSASSASGASLVGESLVFRHLGPAPHPFGTQTLIDTASFEVGAGIEFTTGLMHIDVSDAAITLQVADGVFGLFSFLEGTIFEFEIVSDERFASAYFDLDASCCFIRPADALAPSRLVVHPTLLRIDMGGLGGASGHTIVTQVQTVPEPRTAVLTALGLLLLSVCNRAARCPTRRCS